MQPLPPPLDELLPQLQLLQPDDDVDDLVDDDLPPQPPLELDDDPPELDDDPPELDALPDVPDVPDEDADDPVELAVPDVPDAFTPVSDWAPADLASLDRLSGAAVDILEKPFSPVNLAKTVRQLLTEPTASREAFMSKRENVHGR